MLLPVGRVNVCVLDGVSGTDHHAVAQIDSGVAHAGGVVGSLEKDQITGLCFGFGNVLALIPQAVGGGAPHIVAVLVVDPTDVTRAVKAGFRGGTTPHIGRAHILLGFLVDGRKFAVGQGFCRNLIIDARCAGAVRTTGRQTAVEQIRPTTQRVLKNLVPFPLVVIQFLPDNDFQTFVHQFSVEDAVLIWHLCGNRDSCRADDPDGLIPYLHLYPCGQLVLFFEGLLQLALHLRTGVIVIQGGQERGQLPRVMLDGVEMVLVLVVAGVVGGSALDLFIQLLFQLLIVLLCTPDIPVLGRVHGLPGHLCAAGKEDAAGGKARHDHEDEQNKNAHDHQNVRVAFCKIGNAVDCGTDHRFSFVDDLFHARLRSSGAIGYRFAACGLCRCTRMGGGIVTFTDFLPLFPA